MTETIFHGRLAFQIENDSIRVTVLVEGGHIAEILDKSTGVNPLWVPPWQTIEMSDWSPEKHPLFGNSCESKLLAGIMGHNLCLDLFGPPSAAEIQAGVVAHAEGSWVPYSFEAIDNGLISSCALNDSQLAFERRIQLEGRRVRIAETVQNLSPLDRPIAWTQHVTLGPPFLANGLTEFRMPATKSRALGESADFEWPHWPQADGVRDLRVFPANGPSGGYTAHLMDPNRTKSHWVGWSPESKVAIGYVWNREEFPWLGIWEENRGRTHTPWLGRTLTRGMEFGVSPFPETRRQMIERGSLFDTPGYKWIEGQGRLTAQYYAAIAPAQTIPETLADFEALL
jgi:hypothetical protein